MKKVSCVNFTSSVTDVNNKHTSSKRCACQRHKHSWPWHIEHIPKNTAQTLSCKGHNTRQGTCYFSILTSLSHGHKWGFSNRIIEILWLHLVWRKFHCQKLSYVEIKLLFDVPRVAYNELSRVYYEPINQPSQQPIHVHTHAYMLLNWLTWHSQARQCTWSFRKQRLKLEKYFGLKWKHWTTVAS
jgi:hypothetical protein